MLEARPGINGWSLLITLGMFAVTVLTRCFFFITEREIPLPSWARRGLNYAPIAALAAVVAPGILMSNGHIAPFWHDARLWAALCSGAYCLTHRRQSLVIAISILLGLLVYLPLRLGLGW